MAIGLQDVREADALGLEMARAFVDRDDERLGAAFAKMCALAERCGLTMPPPHPARRAEDRSPSPP